MTIFHDILDKHLGKVLGVLVGLVFGWFAIKYGFFKAIFVLLCVLAGYYIGKKLDERIDFGDFFARFRDR